MPPSDLDTYRDQLRHVVRPDVPEERARADRVPLSDWEALFLRNEFYSAAAYDFEDEDRRDVATAYVEHIDEIVRNEGKSSVWLYAHTSLARGVLDDVLVQDHGLFGERFAERYAEHIEN